MSTDEDRIWVNEVMSGKVSHYRFLVEKYQQPVFRVVFKICGNTNAANEIAHDVFVKAFQSLSQFNPKYKFFSWIYRIAINSALAHVKQNKRMVSIDRLPDMADHNADANNNEIDSLLHKAIEQLPGKYKVLIAMKYYAGHSYTDMAEVLGLEEKKVKSRLFDARKMLKDYLEKTKCFNY
jgi:RNA polymerase sigma-70 factor, ECF subfamily